MVQFASYLRRVLCKTRLVFPRKNGPIDVESRVPFKCLTSPHWVREHLRLVSRRYSWLQRVIGGYRGLQRVTRGYRGLQGVTGGYKGL